MSLSPQEAASTLSDVERAAKRSARAFGYRKASPHLILWGIVWLIGYGATDVFPARAGLIWLALIAAACIVAFYISRCYREDGRAKGNAVGVWRVVALIAIAYVFIIGTYAILGPLRGMQQGAFVPLLVGAVYTGVGLWLGMRFVIAGALLIALTFAGYFYLQEYFLLWMAFAGGGALILAGFWLRTV
ncbi:MAG: hypothetical protein KGJ79_00260 [Alphaproteobacteria bacterium]|nr:hypothetical protein [Alphaproteobacteria bacterium]MDE2109544.1 hypothetical protein [Alphaproteobacteria bacterium]MDE2493329.1 hypothetical protein [Alphaproteobacteria bacterium]